MRIPGVANINKSLVVFKKSLKECLARVNQEAGTLLSKGSSAHAESSWTSQSLSKRSGPRRSLAMCETGLEVPQMSLW